MRILLFGITAVLLMASCNGKTESTEDYEEYKEDLIELKKMVEEMTEQQKQNYIIDGEEVLDKLQKKVASDSIDPETRFQTRRSIKLIEKELDIVRNAL